ncbi:hypothetical protein F3Y22_tig00111166pilonHSYRG00161 [Hibiscus syriacus]|uniref:Uncharacterized protein n=1 Tax=Hibiscus syriacus TaxID=106335 RepID=A0A6A2YWP2_HIBSY|nr:hypothetical protein F3Y22_tig00111166pilonHSYRG00161 [Hibiscus syriacus]
MAFRRSLSSRTNLIARRYQPSFAYIFHDDDRKTHPSSEYRLQPNPVNLDRRCSQQAFFLALVSLLVGMSTIASDGAKEVELMTDVAEAFKDTAIEAVDSVPAVNEVAIAAADCWLPVATLQYVINAVHLLQDSTANEARMEEIKDRMGSQISTMAEKMPSFKYGGAYWFTDLSTPDSLYLTGFDSTDFLLTVECNMQEGMEGNPAAKTRKCIFVYWITSNLFSLTYGLVLKAPGVKKALGVPEIPKEAAITNSGLPSICTALKQTLKQAKTASQQSTSLPVQPTKASNQ